MILAESFHYALGKALPFFTAAAVLGVLAAVVYYAGRHLEEKYPHLKRPPKQKKRRKKK